MKTRRACTARQACRPLLIALISFLGPLSTGSFCPAHAQWAPQQQGHQAMATMQPSYPLVQPLAMPAAYSQQSGVKTFQQQQQMQQQQEKIRTSRFDPQLKVKSHDGYVPASAGPGTFVRIAPSVHAPPLQILVEDRDLQPGMPSAVYQYMLTGYGAERFAVDQHGNLYLADMFDLDGTAASTFLLHVMAREVDTIPKRDSQPISITVHVLDDEHVAPLSPLAQTIYMANVSAMEAGERVIAQVMARAGDAEGPVHYRITEVSDGASGSFRYDEASNELRAVGPLYPGHRYKVVIEARDTDGLVGHAIVLVQALSPTMARANGLAQSLSPLTALLPTKPSSPDQLALIPAELFGRKMGSASGSVPHIPPHISAQIGSTSTMPTPSTIHPTEQNIYVELSELTPPRTLVTSFGDERTLGKLYFLMTAGNEPANFMVEELSGNVLTSGTLDREQAEKYSLRIEARSRAPFDQLLYVTNLHVSIVDTNDNAPQFVGPHPLLLATRLETLAMNSPAQLGQPNLLLGRLEVVDPDQGENGRVSLRVLPPLDRLFTINDAGEVRVNGLLTGAHLGEHHLTIMAVDHGQQAQESRAVLSVRIDGHLGLRETLGSLAPAIGGLSPFGLALAGQQPRPAPLPPASHSVPASSTGSNSADYESEGDKGIDSSAWMGGGGGFESAQERHGPGDEQQTLSAASGIDRGDEKRPSLGQSLASLPPFTRLNPHRIVNGQPTSDRFLPNTFSTGFSSMPPIVEPIEASTSMPQPIGTGFRSTTEVSPAQTTEEDHSFEKPLPFLPESEEERLPPPVVKQLPIQPISSTSTPATPVQSPFSSIEEFGGPRLAPIFESAEMKVFMEENEEQMELIAQLKARYPDGGPGPIHFTLLAGDQSLFNVNSSTGQIILLKALDAESDRQPPIYKLKVGTVEAEKPGSEFLKDPGLAHSCELTVHVVDINDWIPNFEQDHYDFGIPATAEQGTVLGQVTAFDQDLTAPNNKIHYFILPALPPATDASGLFKIDTDSGQLTLNAHSLEEFAGRRVAFRVEAKDGGIDGTELNSTAEVRVHVEGVRTEMPKLPDATVEGVDPGVEMKKPTFSKPWNRGETAESEVMQSTTTSRSTPELTSYPPHLSLSTNSPPSLSSIRFARSQFNASVMEGARPPVLAETLEVLNKPKDTRFTICAIRSGNFRGAFSVAPNANGDCELRTQVQLDREAIPLYALNISVENGGQIGWTMVNVTVLDANDNKPKFVFPPGDDGKHPVASSFFAVLPVETGASEKFFKLKAEDADAPGTGNSLITFELDPQPTAGDGAYFGIEPKTGQIWPKKKARELAQLVRRNYFRLTAVACDTPREPIRQHCTRAPVAISLLEDQHRFILVFIGQSPEQIKRQEKEILQSLRLFTSPCSNPAVERVEEQPETENGQSLVSVHMYAANLKESKLCLKQEFQKMFSPEAKEALTAAMRQWGAEMLDVMGTAEAGRMMRKSGGAGGAAGTDGTQEGLAALLFPIDWNNASTVLIAVAIGVVLIALVGLCALCLFSARHKQMRRRAEQMRRRHHQHRGGFNAAGLLAMNGAGKGPQAVGQGLFAASALPSSYAASSNISNNLYMPTATPLGSGGPNFERGNKYYESQMLELPIGDADEFMVHHRTNPLLLANGNGTNCLTRPNGNGHVPGCNGHAAAHGGGYRHVGEMAHESSSAKSSPNRRHYSSGLLPPPPPPVQRPPHQQKSGGATNGGRRLTNSDNPAFSHCGPGTSAAALRRHNSPPAGQQSAGHGNQEGDFSIDESFYVANGQSRYHFH